ncbi:hypothetical protein D3C87_1006400 [compost metagenome]
MKSIVFVIAMLFSTLSFADERIFDCTATILNKSFSLPEELKLTQSPTMLFRQLDKAGKTWTLQIGQLLLHPYMGRSPALKMESSFTNDYVEYSFWVDGSYEYELQISTEDKSAKLFWWGLGEQVHVGDFNCLMVEQ